MQVHQSPLAFKFANGAGKTLLISTSVDNGHTSYHISVEGGDKKGGFVYQDFSVACDCVIMFMSARTVREISFEMVSMNNGTVGVVVGSLQWYPGSRDFRSYFDGKVPMLIARYP